MIKLPFILSQSFAEAVLVIAVLAMLFSLHKPLRALGVFIIFRPLLQPAASLGYTLSSIPIGAVLPIMLILAAMINTMRPGKGIFHKTVVPLYFIILFSFPSFIISPNLVESFSITVKILTAISAFFITFNNIKELSDIYKIYKYFVISSLIPLSFGFYQYITKTGHIYKSLYYAGPRIDSVLMEWNDYGEYLSILICLFILQYSTKIVSKPKIYEHIIFLAVIISFILALNRGSWIALSIGLVMALPLYRGAIRTRWLVAGFLVVAIAAGGVIVDRFEALNRRDELGAKANTFQGRIKGWIFILEILSESPLTGMGAGASATITDMRGNSFVPHNDYMRVLFESGPFACMAFIVFVMANMLAHLRRSKIRQMRSINYPLFALSIYYAIISFTQNILASATILPMFLICFAISAATTNFSKQELEIKKGEIAR